MDNVIALNKNKRQKNFMHREAMMISVNVDYFIRLCRMVSNFDPTRPEQVIERTKPSRKKSFVPFCISLHNS